MHLRLPRFGAVWLVVLLGMLGGARTAAGEPFRVVIGLSAYSGAERQWAQTHVSRELLRQCLVLAAVHELGMRPHDAVFDGYGTLPKDAPRVEVSTFHAGKRFVFTAAWADGQGEPWRGEFPLPDRQDEDVVVIARHLSAEISGGAAAWLRTRLGEGAWRPAGSVREAARAGGVESGRLDPVSIFERLRRGHGRVAEKAEAANLAELARDYASLGEVVRGWWSPLGSVLTARALLLAELACFVGADEPSARASRVWAYTLAGYHSVALREREATASGSETAPAWMEVLDEALRHRTDSLVRRAESEDAHAELAALLAVAQVDYSGSANYTGSVLGRVEGRLPHNPRPFYTAARQFGVGGLHWSTRGAMETWWQTITERVPRVEGLPPELGKAVAVPARTGSSSGLASWLSLLLETRPPEPDREPRRDLGLYRRFALQAEKSAATDAGFPAWDALGRLLWDGHFVTVVERLHFMAVRWSVATRAELTRQMPGLEGHPLREVAATYGRGDESSDRDGGFERVRLGVVTRAMETYLNRWAWRPVGAERLADRTVERARNEASWWSDNDAVNQRWFLRGAAAAEAPRQAERLLAVSPYDPVGLAALVRHAPDWERAAERARERNGDHPLVAWGMGDRMRREGRWEEAARHLRTAAEALGEKRVFEQLAEAYLRAGNEDLWLATRLEFERFEDQGLGHARNRQEIARHFLAGRRPAEALPHAERAAVSYAEWALQTHAITLWLLGRDQEARKIVDAVVERYGNAAATRLGWHATAGHGTQADLRGLFAQELRASNRAVFLEAIGELDEALKTYLEAYRQDSDNYYLLMAGLLRLEKGERAEARTLFARLAPEYARNRTRNWTRSFNRDLAGVFIQQLDAGFDLARFEAEVARLRGVWVRDEVHRVNADYQGDIAFFLARFALAHGASERAGEWMREAAAPGSIRYITPLVARRLELLGVSYRGLFLPEPK